MSIFRKKEIVNTKYKIKDTVSFRYKGDFRIGLIYKVRVTIDGTFYDVQVGGECPTIFPNIKEEDIHLMNSR